MAYTSALLKRRAARHRRFESSCLRSYIGTCSVDELVKSAVFGAAGKPWRFESSHSSLDARSRLCTTETRTRERDMLPSSAERLNQRDEA